MSPEGPRTFHSHFTPRKARRWSALHPRSAAARALRMAQAIQGRSTGLRQHPGLPQMTLLTRATPPGQSRVEIRLNLRLPGENAPPVSLRASPLIPIVRPVNRTLIEPRPVAATTSLEDVVQGEPVRMHSSEHLTQEPASQSTMEMIRHISEQHIRVETASRYRPADLAPASPDGSPTAAALARARLPTAAELPPLALTVVHPATRSSDSSAAPEASPIQADAGRVGSPAARSLPAAEAPLDVNRLADQVIQAIDRRIIANRERLGRI